MKPKKITIFAAIGSQNLGDELILKNEIAALREEFGAETQFRVASYDPKNPVFDIENTRYFEYFPIDAKNWKKFPKNLKNLGVFFKNMFWSDIVVIGGGGIIYDSENQSVRDPLDQWIFRMNIARKLRKKIYFYAVGIDIKNPENTQKISQVFSGAWKTTVRDQKSFEQLRSLGIDSEMVPDPVLSETGESGPVIGAYRSTQFTSQDLASYDFNGKTIGIAMRSGYLGKTRDTRIEKLLFEEILKTIESKGGEILFLSHSFHPTDLQANDAYFFEAFLTPKRKIIESLTEVYDAYKNATPDIILTMRLHSMILAYRYNIPQLALSYSQKTDEFLKSIQ